MLLEWFCGLKRKRKKNLNWFAGFRRILGTCQLADQLNQLKNDLASWLLKHCYVVLVHYVFALGGFLLAQACDILDLRQQLFFTVEWTSIFIIWTKQYEVAQTESSTNESTYYSGWDQETAMRWHSKLRINTNLLEIGFAAQQWQHCTKGTA